mmetsp:Transcript_43764/g.102125  ORF Transcript_43764/g.102125 Transcript_43764/m.102125 type:complete len:386 (-) Transcript_43764:68-1225(-)
MTEASSAVQRVMSQVNSLDDGDFQDLCQLIDQARAERVLPTVSVTVSQLGGHAFGPQQMPPSTSTGTLKRRLHEALGIAPEEMDLLCGHTLLQADDSLASLGDKFQGHLDLICHPPKVKIRKHPHPDIFVITDDLTILSRRDARSRADTLAVLSSCGQLMASEGEKLFLASDESKPGLGSCADETFRTWHHVKSQVAAGLDCGVSCYPSWRGARLLAVGISALDISYFADLVGAQGAAGKVKYHLLQDPKPEELEKLKFWPCAEKVENFQDLLDGPMEPGDRFSILIFRADLANQAAFLAGMTSLLCPGATVICLVEAGPPGTQPEPEYARHVQALRGAGLRPREQLTLEPFFDRTCIIISKAPAEAPKGGQAMRTDDPGTIFRM